MEYSKEQERAATEDAVDPRTDLAIERTMLAMERTQLSWVRTVMAFITAGFTIDKGASALHQARLVSGEAWARNGHFTGMLLTITSTLLLIMATVIFIWRMKQLNEMRGIKINIPAPTTILSVFMCVVGFIVIYFLMTPW